MGLYDKLVGNAEIGDADLEYIESYLLEDETVIQAYKFIRDSIVLTNYGIYVIDVQGLSGKKVEAKFYPKKVIKTVSFETAGTMDMDVDIKIGVEGNVPSLGNPPVSLPISFKVNKSQSEEAKEIVKLVKQHYLCF